MNKNFRQYDFHKDSVRRYDQNFYKVMADNFGDEIYVTDGKGYTLFVNPKAVEVIGKPVDEIVGKHVEELVEDGFFKPSGSMEAIRKRKQVDIIQTVKDGKKVLCSSVPIFDDLQEEILMVISTTKDVAMINELHDTINDQKEEINNLRDILFEEGQLVESKGDTKVNGIKSIVSKIAPLDVTVLIQGETGVGKEVVAKALHKFSKVGDKALIKINCGTIPENLIESELFGYERGAFTGAEKSGKKGKVELAEGGTLFLDEIGEMPIHMQVKLLDFIQDGSFTRVGGTKKHTVKTRIIAATNRNLKKMCEEGTFRSDLYYRLNVIPVTIPPLRARQDDIDALAKFFIGKCNTKYSMQKFLDDNALNVLKSYDWPGNVRELEHVLEQAYVMSEASLINSDELDFILKKEITENDEKNHQLKPIGVVCNGIMPLKDAKHEVEKQLVKRAQEEFGSTYKAAEALNVDQSTVVKLLKKYK